jgi:hypothetical protein
MRRNIRICLAFSLAFARTESHYRIEPSPTSETSHDFDNQSSACSFGRVSNGDPASGPDHCPYPQA